MLGHAPERGDEFTATFARFDFFDFCSELLFDALAKLHMVWIDDISHKVDAFGDGEDSLVWLDLESNGLQHLVYGITDHP